MHKSALIALIATFFCVNAEIISSHAATISGFGDPNSAPELSGGTVIDFDSIAPGVYPSVSASGVTFTGVGAPLDVGSDFIGDFNTRGIQSLYNNFDLQPQAIEIAFNNPVSAAAFNWGAADNIWDMTAFDSGNNVLETFVINPVNFSNVGDFFGIAAAGIVRITLADRLDNISDGDFVFIDNFTFKNGISTVPLPGAVWLMLTAIAGLGALCRIGKKFRPRVPFA